MLVGRFDQIGKAASFNVVLWHKKGATSNRGFAFNAGMHILALLFVHDSLSMYIRYTVNMNTVDEVYELSMVHRSPARNRSTPNCPVPMGTFFGQTLRIRILLYLNFSGSESFWVTQLTLKISFTSMGLKQVSF